MKRLRLACTALVVGGTIGTVLVLVGALDGDGTLAYPTLALIGGYGLYKLAPRKRREPPADQQGALYPKGGND
jgi:hypothetical protein